MSWTRQTPIVPGWYWHSDGRVAKVGYLRHDGIVQFPTEIRYVDKLDGEWQGPIEPEDE